MNQPLEALPAQRGAGAAVAGGEPAADARTPAVDARDVEALDVLLVADEAEARLPLSEDRREAGHRVTLASDGGEARGHVRARVFDVVICDVRLPQVDGL